MTNVFRIYPLWTCVLWTVILAVVGVVELLGLRRFHGAIPLTWMIRDSMPAWLRWMLMGWIALSLRHPDELRPGAPLNQSCKRLHVPAA